MNPQIAAATLQHLVAARLRPRVGSHLWLRVWAKRLITLPALISICARRAALRRAGANIGALSVVNAKLIGPASHLTVGAGSVICQASIALHAPVTIGDNVVVNDGVEILTASHDLADPEWKMFRNPIEIGDYAWIAQGAMLLPGVRVGRGAVVGARAVVTHDVEPHTVVAGNPARPTRTRRVEDLRYSPASFMSPYAAWLGTRTRSAQW